jgi:preprotein translocase subunit SecA
MQETTYRTPDGEIKRITEMFNLPMDDTRESVLRKRYETALQKVFAEKGELLSIKQGKIGRNDKCPCGSGRKFKRCCEARMNVAMNAGE